MAKISKIFKKIQEAVEDGETDDIVELVEEALEDEETAEDILNLGLLAGMDSVGVMFKEGEMFVPEVLLSAETMNQGMAVLKPYLTGDEIQKSGKVVFCTVVGDLHDIGKKLCVMLMQGSGYDVVDLGTDVDKDKIVAACKEKDADIVAMSAMLTTTMVSMGDIIEALKAEGMGHVKVMVGGAPLSTAYAEKIGANYSEDAVTACALADNLMGIVK